MGETVHRAAVHVLRRRVLDADTHCRFHNIYGPFGTYDGGREKAPAAICRKVAQVEDGGSIEIWGDGEQTRSFCYIDDCVEGIYRIMQSDYAKPLNLGTDEMVSIKQLAYLVAEVAGKRDIGLKQIPGPQGVRTQLRQLAAAQGPGGGSRRRPCATG